jgi:hypothetical protein
MHSQLLAAITNPAIPPIIGDIASGATGGSALGRIIGAVVGGILLAATLLALFYLLTGGVSWITSGGDKNTLESSRNKITHAIIGLVIVASIWAVMTLIGPWLGIGFPVIKFPTIIDTTGPASTLPNTAGTTSIPMGN